MAGSLRKALTTTPEMAQIDPSIILGAKPLQIRDPLESYGNALAIQNAQQTNALRAQQMQQANEDRAYTTGRRNKLNAILGEGLSGEELENTLLRGGFSEEALKFGKDRRENLKTDAERKKTEAETGVKGQELQDKRLQYYRTELDMVNSRPAAIQWMTAQYNDPVLANTVMQMQPLEKTLASIPQDPAQFQEWRNKAAMGMDKYIANQTTVRGQNLTAETARRGQDIHADAMVKAAKATASNKDFERSDKLRDEFQKGSGEFVKVRDAYERIQRSSQAPSAAGDLSLIFNYMKLLDPGSVVREGEFATAQNAAGIPDRIRNAYNRAINGERLNPDQRTDFLSQADRLYDGALTGQQKLEQQYTDFSTSFGVDPKNVITDYRIKKPAPSGNNAVSATSPEAEALLAKYPQKSR